MGGKSSFPIQAFSLIGSAVGGIVVLKSYMGGETFKDPVRADEKVVVITGANTGIGKEATRELAKRGAKVIMACRDLKRCEKAREEIVLETKNKFVYCRKCDLASQKSIKEFVERFKTEENRLDVLINNAGVMRCPLSRTKDGIEMQLGVNHMGHFLLTTLLLDYLKKSAPSRIVNVSSIAHKRGDINLSDFNSDLNYDPGDAYAQSKLANILFTKELDNRLKGTGVTVNAIHPGIVDTELMRHMGYYKSFFAGIFIKPFVWLFLKTPKQGAQQLIFASLSPDLEKVSGKYYADFKEAETSDKANDPTLAHWLWAVSEKWTINNQYYQQMSRT